MPETPINEHGQASFREPEVWLASHGAWVHLPSTNATPDESKPQSPFRRTVSSRSHLRHQYASFSFCERIHLRQMREQMSHRKYNVVELYAGISRTWEPFRAWRKCRLGLLVDIDPYARQTYNLNHPSAPYLT